MTPERAIHTVTGTKVCPQTGVLRFSTRTAPLVLPGTKGNIACGVKLESTSATGSWGERFARQLIDELASPDDTPIVVAAPPWLALPLAAAAATVRVDIELELDGYAPDGIMNELLLYGAKTRYRPAPQMGAGVLRRAIEGAISHLVQEIADARPDFLLLPEDELLPPDAFTQAFPAGQATKIIVVDWKKRRSAAFSFACEIGSTCGLLLGLPGAAALKEASALALKGEFGASQSVLVLDPYATKFFAEYAHIPRRDREENKLGGLITPR